MFAIDHAATALLVKRRFPSTGMAWLLISVQLMEILWVVFNYIGLERTTTEPIVRSVADIHLAYMPYSHSVASGLALGVVAWVVGAKILNKPALGWALGAGVVSHLVLDLVTHAPDIALAPGLDHPKLGLGLYNAAPVVAFVIEIVYGVFCWAVYRGGKALLAIIVLFNLGNLSMLSSAVPGPEGLLAGRPLILVTVIAVQIAVTLILVGIFSRVPNPPPERAS